MATQAKIMQDQLIAAESAGRAMVEANRINNEGLITGRRAWMTIDYVNLRSPTVATREGTRLTVEVGGTNVGITPALNTWMEYAAVFPLSDNLTKDVLEKLIEQSRRHPKTFGETVYPKTSFKMAVTMNFEANDILKERTKDTSFRSIILIVVIKYRIVGDDAIHLTQRRCDCFHLKFDTEVSPDQTTSLSLDQLISGISD